MFMDNKAAWFSRAAFYFDSNISSTLLKKSGIVK